MDSYALNNDIAELDLEYLEELSGGDVEFEQEILDTFLETAPDLLDDLQASFENGDAAAVRHAAHTLKGSSRSIGGQRFSMVCERVEQFAKAGDLVNAKVHHPELLERYDSLKRACREHISKSVDRAA